MADLHLDPVVVDGEADRIGDGGWVRGGSGTVQLRPRGVAHAIRVPRARPGWSGCPRAPYDGFARETARLPTAAAPLSEVVAVAERFGVRLG
ncbi:hypothetical protein ACI8AF_05925 [Blastococcus sp. SYSU D00669]